MENLIQNILEAKDYISKHTNNFEPAYGIILGTGLGGLVQEIEIEYTVEYKDIPHFAVSTVESHQGKLILGKLGGKNVIAMSGRFHYYEGYGMKQVTFPVRVMKYLGIKKLFISNASGGLAPTQMVGDLMILNDHINLMPEHPLRGKNYNELGPRFPSMHATYDVELINRGMQLAADNNIRCSAGVYCGVSGPCLETPAEYKYLRVIGGDAVGMSTVPEVIVAHHMDLPVFAISVITDVGILETPIAVSLEDVVAAAKGAEPKLTLIIKELIKND